MPLSQLGVGSFNRPVSPKYVHHLLRLILDRDGFTRFRYKNAIALEPKPDDPGGATRRTNDEAARSGGLLPIALDGERFHLATKNHLYLGLCCVGAGHIFWDDKPGQIIVPPDTDGPSQAELHETLKNGLFVEVLSASPPYK
jgi:hypothetical protein